MAGRETGGGANARDNCRPAGPAVRRPCQRRELAWRIARPSGSLRPCPDATRPPCPHRRPTRQRPAARAAGVRAHRFGSASWLGGLRLLEVLLAQLAVAVVDRLDV